MAGDSLLSLRNVRVNHAFSCSHRSWDSISFIFQYRCAVASVDLTSVDLISENFAPVGLVSIRLTALRSASVGSAAVRPPGLLLLHSLKQRLDNGIFLLRLNKAKK